MTILLLLVVLKERERGRVQKNQKSIRNLGSQNAALKGVKLIIIKLIKYVIII